MTWTFASVSSSAARRILSSSNCRSEASEMAISVTVKRLKCALASGTPESIAEVIGSSAVLDEGVSIPRRTLPLMRASKGKSEIRAQARALTLPSHRQLAAVVDEGRAHQERDPRQGEEHQRQKVRAGPLDDEADDDRNQDSRDIAAEVHAAAKEARTGARGENAGDRPVHAAPAQEEQGRRQQSHDRDRIADIGDAEDGEGRNEGRDAEQDPEDEVRRSAARAPPVADLPADEFAHKPGEKHDEQGSAELLDVQAMNGREIARHPGQEAIPDGVEEHPAQAHAPE